MAKIYNVYGLGAAMVDTEINVTDADLFNVQVEKGFMTIVNDNQRKHNCNILRNYLSDAQRTAGGSTANSIVAIAQFGGKAFYSCKVGNDKNGEFYLADLKSAGVDFVIDKSLAEGATGTCIVMVTPDAERTLNSFLGVNEAFSEEDLVPEAIATSRYIYFGAYLGRSTTMLRAAMCARQVAQKNGVKAAINLSDPDTIVHYRNEICQMLGEHIDLLFCNRREALVWTQTDNLDVAIERLKISSETFVITLGAEGALVYDGLQLHRIQPCKVPAINTNGAGDMFAGAFLFAITHGCDYPTAGRLASMASAAVVSTSGSRLSVIRQQEILNQWKNS